MTLTGRVRMLVNGGTGLATEKEEERLMGAGTQEQGPCLCRKRWAVSLVWKPEIEGGPLETIQLLSTVIQTSPSVTLALTT